MSRAVVTIQGRAERQRAKPGEASKFLRDVVLLYREEECLIWPFARNGEGYGHLSIDGKNVLVHRIACEAMHGLSPTPWHDAAHSCGNGNLGCCSPMHVRWATPKENQQDMVAHGRSQRGERMHMSKLTDDAVRDIRSSSASNAEMARKYGVTSSNICVVRRGKSWRHVS